MSTQHPRVAYAVWAVGVSAYLLAIFHRSSLAVAGFAATERFDISAAQLASFTMLQLLVYAAMQVPVGLLVDRFGPRAVMLTGIVVLSLAQLAFALAASYPVALAARTFVGMGDAMTWICVIRLVSRWFPTRRIPFVTQLSGMVGQAGALIAAVPMTWALSTVGWTGAYLASASVGIVVAVGVLLVVRDAPSTRTLSGPPMSFRAVRDSVRASWSHPGTRLGFWMHFTTPFSANMLSMLWGYPFFVQGEGVSESTAGLLLTLMIVAFMYSGPLLGYLIGRHPWHRSSLVLGIVSAVVIVWTAVLLWPGAAPLWLLVLLTQVVGLGGPASMVGFDLARTSNPSARLASATGLVNVAGFVATLVLVLTVGLVLDWRTPGASTDYTPEAFRWAMASQYVLWTLGLTQILRYRRRARAVIDRAALQAGTPAT